ncbi:hypothetical protein C5Y97_02900 [Blastopirellula marina]|uniref:Uncharacterized protein n=1 Tax=Blastopirellula marina TaxID=124 RepID=A0A2S8GB51_9BACT|nr:hypothetical protein C5Y98_02900 [Blastopirellula marina]PTL46131.1 hypothetical protein C5Y97_02900 [Blastopirellula marina]
MVLLCFRIVAGEIFSRCHTIAIVYVLSVSLPHGETVRLAQNVPVVNNATETTETLKEAGET